MLLEFRLRGPVAPRRTRANKQNEAANGFTFLTTSSPGPSSHTRDSLCHQARMAVLSTTQLRHRIARRKRDWMFQHEMWALPLCLVPSPFSHRPRVIPETTERCFTSRTVLRDTYLRGPRTGCPLWSVRCPVNDGGHGQVGRQ